MTPTREYWINPMALAEERAAGRGDKFLREVADCIRVRRSRLWSEGKRIQLIEDPYKHLR